MNRCIYIILLLFGCYFQLVAQNQCAQSLNNARTMFDEGHFYPIPAVLQECLNWGFSREQRIQAYHLLTMAYLYMDELDLAEVSYLKLLKFDPEFDVEKDNDNIEIVYLNSKYKTTPIFTLTARAGVNLTTPVVLKDYAVNQNNSEAYDYRPGYWFGPGIDLSINEQFKVGAELLFRRTSFSYRSKRFNEDDLEVTQVQRWISFPILVKYTYGSGKIYPYAYTGIAYDHLISSSGTFEFENVTEDQGSFNIKSSGVDLTLLRNRASLTFIGGIGVRKRIGYQYIFAEFRFLGGLQNIINTDNRYLMRDDYLYDFEALFQYTYVDDDMRLNSFGFSIGYELPFYKPRKITPQKKGFLKNIFN